VGVKESSRGAFTTFIIHMRDSNHSERYLGMEKRTGRMNRG